MYAKESQRSIVGKSSEVNDTQLSAHFRGNLPPWSIGFVEKVGVN